MRRRAPRSAPSAPDDRSQDSRTRPYTSLPQSIRERGAHGGEPVYGGLAVYTGNAHPQFAKDVCATLEMPLGNADVFKFANDNIFVKINENVREQDVYILQSLTARPGGIGV